MLIRFSGPIAAALAVAVTVTSFNLSPAQAAPRHSSQPQAAQSDAATTDFSARRRHYRRGNAAALGAVIGLFGTIAAVAAAERYRDDYYYGRPYYGSYGYYGGGPYYYAPAYRYRHRHHYYRWR